MTTPAIERPAGATARWGVFAVYLVVWFNFYDQMAVLPLLSPRAEALGAASWLVGLIVGVYSVTSAAGNVLVGPLLDRFGRWPFVVLGLCLMSGTAALHAAADTPAALLGVRLVHGLVGGLVAPAAFTLLGDLVPEGTRAGRMASAGAAIAFAALLAPPMSGAVADRLGFGGAFLFLAALLLVGAAVAALFLPRIEAAAAARRHLRRQADGAVPDPAARRLPLGALLPYYGAGFTLMLGQGVLFYALPLLAREAGLAGRSTGLLFAAFAVGALVAFLSPLRGTADRVGARIPIVFGLLLASAMHLALSMAGGFAGLFAAQLGLGLGFGLVFPALGAGVADATGFENRGRAFGLHHAMLSVGALTGPVAGGLVAGAFSPFWLSAAVLAAWPLGLGIVWPYRTRDQRGVQSASNPTRTSVPEIEKL
jgi:MFS transporter, DHA1 family, multidrug resistance protein